jgi:tetratricopeptide (TPR) repeat protein
MKKYFGIILLVILCLGNQSFGQFAGDSLNEKHIQNGIKLIYNLSFDSAHTEFQQVIYTEPNSPAGYFFLAMIDWWKIIIDIENESHDEKYFSELERVIQICDDRLDKDENDLTALFFKGGSVGFRGRLHANREDWIKAANDGRIALPIVHQAYKLGSNNEDILFGIGIYNYYASVIPENYPIVKPLMIFFPDGDKNKGIQQLRRASEKARYAKIEASYFLLQLLFNYEKKYLEALEIASNLHKQFPNNVVFHKYVGRCHTTLGRWNEAYKTYKEISDAADSKKIGYNTSAEREALFYLGFCEMNDSKYETALRHFYRCDELSRTIDREGPSSFMVMTNLNIGKIYDAQSKRELALKQYQKVIDMKEYQDSHSQAKSFMKNPYRKF